MLYNSPFSPFRGDTDAIVHPVAHRRQTCRQPLAAQNPRFVPGDPKNARPRALRRARRNRPRRRRRQARFRRMARHPGARPRARDVRIPAAAEAKSRSPRPRRRRRQRQNLRRRARRCLARHRSRRASVRRPRRDARRFARQPRARRRHRLLHRPARRRRRRHAVQFPGDDPALDVPARRRLRQHFRLKAVRAGAAGGDGIGQIVYPSGRSGGRFANRPWRRRGGRSNPRPS